MNVGWGLVPRLLRMVVGLFVGVWVARHLGPGDFGLLNFALSAVGILMSIASLGISDIVVRDALREPERKGEILGTAVVMRGVAALGLIGLMLPIALSPAVEAPAGMLALLLSAAAIFEAVATLELYFQAKVQIKQVTIAQVTSLVVGNALKVVLILVGAGVFAFAGVLVLEAALIAGVLVVAYARREGGLVSLGFNRSLAVRLLRQGWPLILGSLAVSLSMRVDQVMLQTMAGPQPVGIYAAAVRLSEAIYFVPLTLTAVLYPAVVNAHGRDATEYRERMQRQITFLVLLAVAFAAPLCAFAPWIIGLLYGQDFSESIMVLRILAWAAVPVFFSCAWSKWIVVEGLQRQGAVIQAMGVVINIAFNLYLIPRYGAVGAALATLGSYTLGPILLGLVIPRQRAFVGMLFRAFLLRGLFRRW